MILPLTPVRLKLHAVRAYGNKTGVVCENHRFTYREFGERVDRLSSALVKLGIQKGDRVAFLSFNCHRLLEAYFAVPQISSVLLCLNVRLSPEELIYILNDAGPRLLFFDPEFVPLLEFMRPRLSTVEHFIPLRERGLPWAHAQTYDELLAATEPGHFDFTQIDENSVTELFYTSGTTAHPKGVMLTHRNLYLHALYASSRLRATDADAHLYTIPLFHVNSWGAPQIVTLLGGRHVIIRKFEPLAVMELIRQEKISRLQGVPTMIIALLNHPQFRSYDLSSLKEINLGGAPCSTALIRQIEAALPGCVALGGYGLTETSPVISFAQTKAHLVNEPEDVILRRKATAGFEFPGAELRVVNSDDQDVKPDATEVGEIIVRGDAVMEGYWRQPEVTAAAIRNGWFHTGDLATIDEEGYILIVDRAKDMILSGGENIASAEIERVLYAHPAVLECAVVAVPDEKWGEVPKAVISVKAGQTATEEEIIAHCAKHLGGFKLPKSVEFLDSLPKGGTGKIQKRVLREKYWEGRTRKVN
jgi:acyl-CoA synthetase (AMP-forming)/AMP-acid ligase II